MAEMPSTTRAQPTAPLNYREAIRYLERWIEAEILTTEERAKGVVVSIIDYFDRECSARHERPWCGVRVVEVDFHTKNAGASYVQVEAPIGLAVCAQVERCLLALIEGWNAETEQSANHETDEEFDRLRSVFAHAGLGAAATTASEPAILRLIVDHQADLAPERTVRAGFLSYEEIADALGDVDGADLAEITAALRSGIPYHYQLGDEDVYLIAASAVGGAPSRASGEQRSS
jgi:hypothetical protein